MTKKLSSFIVTETTERRKGKDYPVLEISTRKGESLRVVSTPAGTKLSVA